jgi:hypothetical protein
LTGASIDIDFTHSPTIGHALIDRANVMGIMGPVGSGKSHGCSAKIMWHAELQHAQPDGWKRARYAIIRNTGPELKSTTIKTFTAIFPEGPHGRVTYSAPITYHMKFPPRDGQHGLDIEIMFLALDNPTDVKKLLSLELTGAWVNEAREINPVIIDALTGRVGRYPSMAQGGCVQPMTWCDTNPPDEDNWWYQYFETQKEPIKFRLATGEVIDLSYRLYRQPPAVLELREMSNGQYESIEPGFDYIFERDEVIPSAGTYWGINPEAENLSNLDPGYYARQLINKSRTHIQVYAQGKYGYVRTGKAVVPEFNHELQVMDVPLLRDQPIYIGVDIGGGTLTPAAVIGQVSAMGTKIIHHELCAKDMGVDNFTRLLKDFLNVHYADFSIEAVYTDPAAEQRDQVFETKINEYLRAAQFPVRAAPTNAWKVRRQAIADPCSRLIGGKPALLIHPRCATLINGLKGKWDFRKMKVVGAEMYADAPSKNIYSHPCDALGYFCSGLGEGQPMRQNRSTSAHAAFKAGSFKAKEGDYGL